MAMRADTRSVTVRMIAMLDAVRRERGLPTTVQFVVPPAGSTALEIAQELELPIDRIEGVFLNYRGAGLDAHVAPGDRVAFVPRGTPASHPAFFGSFETRDTRAARGQ